ncbi:MAG: SMC family ATPase [Rhodothermales bacterium]
MVPVELRVSNFLSYGAETEPLDFQSFHVACLSGRNGQGKSALLDAITWALWGEARKSSGSHKPDEELLRIGATRMRVELVFDVEGTRYRVLRGYARSASGKTSKPELELHVMGESPDQGKPLTRASIRETQEVLDELLGLDYQTFINSAFLLQGRSDEFTKKRPNERKDILARILNLEKYERLSLAARDRERVYSETADRLNEAIERLGRSLEAEAACRQDRDALQAEIEAGTALLEEAAAGEAEALRLLAEQEGKLRERDATQATLQRLASERTHIDESAAELTRQIAGAEAILAKAEAIESAYERLQTLQVERDALDEKRDLYRGVEKQIEQRTHTLRETVTGLEKKIHALEIEERGLDESRRDMELQLRELPEVLRNIEAAKRASGEVDRLLAAVEQRNALQETVSRLEQTLVGLREALVGEQRQLAQQLARRRGFEQERRQWETARDRLAHELARKEEVDRLAESLMSEGQAIKEAIRQKEGMIEGTEAEIQRLAGKTRLIEAAAEGDCPTCGQPLTAAHRDTVRAQYDAERLALEKALREARDWIAEQEKRRDDLRGRYRDAREEQQRLSTLADQLVAADAQGADLERRQVEFDQVEDRLGELTRQIDRHAFGEAQRTELDAALAARDAIAIDEQALEAARTQRARLQHDEERRRFLLQLEARHETSGKQLDRVRRDLAEAREALVSGEAVRASQTALARLREQLAAIGFDPERFDAIRQELRTLGQAGLDYKALADARLQLPAWNEQRGRLEQRRAGVETEHLTLRKHLEALTKALPDIETLQRDAAERRERREAIAARLREMDVRSGELNAQLERFERDRIELKEARTTLKETEHERRLYRHLRAAFGKNGIPSLIIEETLPDIEVRANALLDRLSDGRMHVRLETLKDKKTGGTKETLEIIITDEQGVARPYETFSGGEAFRVNFALRIALSQLLAERQGVRIRTLGIDEGFGTQDEQGIQNLIEAIQVIQDDFDKILVITHLEQLKEAFPVRIEVEKHPVLGSQFQVLGV